MKRMFFLVATLALAGALPLRANNIRVANVATGHQDIDQQQAYVAFDLSWENSWRNDVNWDAAWVFVKFRPEGSNAWQHVYLSTNKADHLMPSGATVDVGTTEIAGTERGMGVFIYRNGAYTGDVSYVNTRLLWKYGENGYDFARGDQVEFSVHAIEMVYVAEGAFWVGSGGTESGSFTDGKWLGGNTIPLLISSENALAIEQTEGSLWALASIGDPGVLPATYPKGYGAFYCMKYEITQGQYAEFLNKLESVGTLFPNVYNSVRHSIRQSVEGVYIADAPDRACNYLYWYRFAPYAAWAGLRPMTEMEFEKACRGPENPVPEEYAWGSTWYQTISSLIGEDGSGTETYGAGNVVFGGSSPGGPVRVGIFAATATNRVSAGASYWGIMELSGNLYERIVTVGNATGRLFEGTHGDGTISLPLDWPQTNGTGSGLRGGGYRGGDSSGGVANTRISARPNAATASPAHTQHDSARAVRSAPSGI